MNSVADLHSFFADLDPDPGKMFNADPDHDLGQSRRAKYQYKGSFRHLFLNQKYSLSGNDSVPFYCPASRIIFTSTHNLLLT
jgi:hypothetical protein